MKFFRHKKGQAALEFVMTYGWAILAAIIAIGVLVYLGVFSGEGLAPDTAIVSNPFYIPAHNVEYSTGGATTTVNFEIQNNGGESVEIQSIDICGGTDSTVQTISPGDRLTYNIGCTPVQSSGQFSEGITVVYRRGTSSLNQQSTGTVSASIVTVA